MSSAAARPISGGAQATTPDRRGGWRAQGRRATNTSSPACRLGVHDRRRRRSRPSELEFRYQSSAGAGGVFANREREAAKRSRPSSGPLHGSARQQVKRKTTCTLLLTRSGSASRMMTTSRHEHGGRGARTRRAPRVSRLRRWHRRCLGCSRGARGAGEQASQARRAFAEPPQLCARSRPCRRSSDPTPHRA